MTTAQLNMLTKLVFAAQQQTTLRRQTITEDEIRERAGIAPPPRDFAAALSAPGLGVIAELKPRSPSRGWLVDDYRPAELAAAYRAGGASAISVLTHAAGFGGSVEDLPVARAEGLVPVLRKDFIIDDYQLYEARAFGADAVLLIVAALPGHRLAELLQLTWELGMEALVEVHNAAESDAAIAAGARVIGVNHRDLRDFSIDMTLSGRVREHIGPDRLLVAESGIRGPRDAQRLRTAGADAVLVGELLMRSDNPATTLKELISGAP
ncbi:MAG: indole-3-glycerol phosphate synthase TrpC [Kibdelosporangium sp.]